MAIPKPEGESFNRLLVSVGAACLGLAFGVPWLILREDGSLTIPEEEVDRLTPAAQEIIRDRQEWLDRLQSLLPYWAAALTVAGVGLLFWGAIRLHERQTVDDDMAKAQRDAAQQQVRIGKQSAEQVSERRAAEVEQEIEPAAVIAAVRGSTGNEQPTAQDVEQALTTTRSQLMERALAAEHAVLQGLGRAIQPADGVTIQPELAINGLALRFDFLVRRSAPAEDDDSVLVEVKVSRPESLRKNLSNRVREFAGSVFIARDALGPRTTGLLVIVVDDSEAVFDTAEVAKISDRAQAIAPAGVRVECVPSSLVQEWTPSLPWA